MPLEFADKDGDAAGMMPDFVRWLANRIGFEPEFYADTAPAAAEALVNGQCDVITTYLYKEKVGAGLAVTPVVMEIPTFIFVSTLSPVRSLEDLHGAVIAVAKKVDLGFEYTPLPFDTLDQMVRAVAEGRVDALVCMGPVLRYYDQTQGCGVELRAIEPSLFVSKLSMAFDEAQRPLQSMLSRGVEESRQEGTARWIAREWVGPEYGTVGSQILRRIQYVIYGLIFLIAALLLFWLWDIRLTRNVREKTEALQQSEERLRTIFQNSPDAIFIESQEGVVLDANPAACAFHGMGRDELLGQNVLDFVPEDQREEVRRTFQKWFSGEMESLEGVSLTSDGRSIPVEVIGAPIQFEGQTAVLLLVRNTTRRTQAEQALKGSEMRYRGLIETQSNLIVRADVDGKLTFVNEAFCRFVGRNRGELIGTCLDSYIYYDDVDEPIQLKDALISRRERMVVTERRMRARTRTAAWVHWEGIAVFDEMDQAIEIQSVGQDITDRRRMDEALRESEKRLSFLFEEIPGIAVKGYNAKREVIFWNRASETLFGFSKQEALGKKMEDLVPLPDRREEVIASFDAWMKNGEEIPPGEKMKRCSDGREVAVYSSYLATRNQQGEWEMYVIDVDLSELKRANEELVKAKDFAEKTSRVKSEFLANMSHEIRTPMNGVMGMTGLLMDTKLDDEQRTLAQAVMDSTNDLLAIIDELLDISRIEAGEIGLQMEPFCPRETIEKITRLFAGRAEKKGVDLLISVQPDLPEKMMGDAGRIRQVLINLVGNALKFTYDGYVKISLRAEKVENGWNLIAGVKDTGIGMDPELQERVFDKFTQGDTSSTREHGGAGLGLAITKQLIELMGGGDFYHQ